MEILLQQLPFHIGQCLGNVDALGFQCFCRCLLIEFADFQTQMAAAGVDDDIQIAIVVLIHFNKVIAAAKGADAQLRPVQVHGLYAQQLLQIDIFCKAVGFVLNRKAGRDHFPDQLVQLLQFQMFFFHSNRFHAAADIHAHQIGADLILNGHGGSHGAAGAGMDIRHHADAAALGIRLIQQVDDLRYRLPVHHIGVDEGLCIFSSQLDHFVLSFKGSRG